MDRGWKMSKFLDDERQANLERMPLIRVAKVTLENSMGRPVKERLRLTAKLLEILSYAKTFAGLGEAERALPEPSFPVKTGEDCKIAATVSDEAQRKYERAIKAYTEDGRNGVFWRINGAYREFQNGIKKGLAAINKMDKEAKKTDDELTELFDAHSRLRSSIRVYRGISPKDADKLEKSSAHIEYAYSSTSTSFSVAFDYAIKKGGYKEDYSLNGAVMVVDLPAGFPAISLEDRSAKPFEKEVLLRKKCTYIVDGVTIADTVLGRYRIFHLVGRLA